MSCPFKSLYMRRLCRDFRTPDCTLHSGNWENVGCPIRNARTVAMRFARVSDLHKSSNLQKLGNLELAATKDALTVTPQQYHDNLITEDSLNTHTVEPSE